MEKKIRIVFQQDINVFTIRYVYDLELQLHNEWMGEKEREMKRSDKNLLKSGWLGKTVKRLESSASQGSRLEERRRMGEETIKRAVSRN